MSSGDPVTRIEGHRSVLLHETIDSLALQPNDVVVDATLGGAGHAQQIVEQLGKKGVFIGIDADQDAVDRARVRLAGAKPKIYLAVNNFKNFDQVLEAFNVQHVTKVLFDLGWSSYQLDSGRGFSFLKDEPLRMTYSKDEKALNAEIIVNTWGEGSIADVIFGWGQERFSRRIAKAIVAARETKRIETSRELGEIIKSAVPASYRFGRIHPATKSFQALRIAVNDELSALKAGITEAWHRLSVGGRISVITFHSIEDREVKQLFAQFAKNGGQLVTKKPIPPTKDEIIENPRARSAKLRTVQKLS